MAYFIEIGNTQYKIVDAVYKKNQLVITSFKTVYSLMDQENLHQVTSELQSKKTKNTTVIANNTSTFYRELKVPVLDNEKTLQIIRNELTASQTISQEMLLDFLDLGMIEDEKLRKILVCGLPVSVVNSYTEMLKEVNCRKIRTIEVGNRALFNYLSKTTIKDNTQPYIVLEIINGLLKVFLFDEQKFVLLRSARISFDNYTDLVATIKEEISLMQQFQMTRHYQSKIESIYMFGDFNGFDKLITDLSQTLPMAIEVVPAISHLRAPEEFNYLSYIHILGSLVGNPKLINFNKLNKEYHKEKNAMDAGKKRMILIGSAIVVIFIAVYGGLFYLNEQLKEQINAEKIYTTNEENIFKASSVLEDESILAAYGSIINEIASAQSNLDIIPNFNSYTTQTIFGYEGASIEDMSTELGVITINVRTKDTHMPVYYSDHLKNSGVFEAVNFNEIRYDKEKDSYTFAVHATMNRGE